MPFVLLFAECGFGLFEILAWGQSSSHAVTSRARGLATKSSVPYSNMLHLTPFACNNFELLTKP